MIFNKAMCKAMFALTAGAMLSVLVQQAAYAGPVPAQAPLLSTTGVGVAPNLMLTMDDSGSMQFRHMPETVFAGGTFTTANPVGDRSVRWDPRDTYQTDVNFNGTVPGNKTSTNYVLRALRSPDTNTIFYNPETRYQPWLTSDGVTRLPNSPVAAAYKNPVNRTFGGVVDLTGYTAPAGTSRWCYTGASIAAATGAGCATVANNNASLNHDPGVYFRLQTITVSANALVVGKSYTISVLGSTDFTAVGAQSNVVGVTFTATRAGTGSGKAIIYKAVDQEANYSAYSINDAGPFTKYPNRTDCAGTDCTQAEDRQNFANWFTYYRTRNLLARGALMESFANVGNTLRLGFGRINKVSAQVDGANSTVIESDTTIYGGGGVRAFNQTRKDQLFKWLEDLPASGSTPLPAALNAVGTYYSRTDNRGPYTDDPSLGTNVVADNKTCRRSYHLMVTDGYWNGSPPNVGDQDSTAGVAITGGSFRFSANTPPYKDGIKNTLADVAMKYWKADIQLNIDNKIRPGKDDPSYWQTMTNYMVGLGVRGSLDPLVDLPALTAGTKSWPAPSSSVSLPANIDDLWHAAVNTRGAYYSANDPASLALAIQNSLTGAQGGGGATAGVATISSVLENGNRKYVPTYDGNTWSGNISAQPLDANGQATAAVWNAAARLPAWNARNIFTWDSGSAAGVAFDWAALSATNKTAMTSGSANLVNFLRGDHSEETSLTYPLRPYRERKDEAGNPFVLGDFVNSNPLLIKGLFDGGYSGLGLGGSTAYQTFMVAKAKRDAVLFVGGNDGMLHGFKDVNLPATATTDGRELFAYVPLAVYPNLAKLSDKNYGTTAVPHQFYVDGPQSESDAYIPGPGYAAFSGQPSCATGATCWRNLLLGSLGAGGRAIYALDVTSSPTLNASNILWEITSDSESDLGYVIAPIEVGVLPNGKWVALFGNGFSSTNGRATLFMVDLASRAVTKLNVDVSGNNGLGGVGVQRNASGEIINLYAGDLKGNLWKFDYDTATAGFVVSNSASALFTATSVTSVAQAITQPPSIFDHSLGGKIIVFGTGKLFETTDRSNTDTQSIYGIWDKPLDTETRPMSRSILKPRSLAVQPGTVAGTTFYTLTGSPVDWVNERGWVVDLSSILVGGRVIYPPQAINTKLVLVTAVAPPQSAAVCDANFGVSVDLLFNVEDGVQTTYQVFDTTGDGVVNSSDALVAGVLSDSVGRRAIVVGIGGGSGGGPPRCEPGFHPVSIQTAIGQEMTCVPDQAVPGTRPFDRVWRRIINPPIR